MPLRHRVPVTVAEVNPARVVEEDVEVGPRLAGRLDGLLRQVDRSVRIGERASLLTPRRGRQHDVGQLGGLRAEDVLHHEEQPLLGQDLPDPTEFGQ